MCNKKLQSQFYSKTDNFDSLLVLSYVACWFSEVLSQQWQLAQYKVLPLPILLGYDR
jgi:hypothetical protein